MGKERFLSSRLPTLVAALRHIRWKETTKCYKLYSTHEPHVAKCVSKCLFIMTSQLYV